jgi:hypothetical protein
MKNLDDHSWFTVGSSPGNTNSDKASINIRILQVMETIQTFHLYRNQGTILVWIMLFAL